MALMAPLDKKYELEPPGALPVGYAPPLGIPYKVKTGESWVSLARDLGYTDVWDLIEYNFHTRDPRHVNHYLRVNVGCVYTKDLVNWSFSDEAMPGIVFYPIDRKPVVPAPPKPESYHVPGLLKPIAVPPLKHYCCWAIAGTIMIRWRTWENKSISDAMLWAGPLTPAGQKEKWLRMYEKGQALGDNNWFDFAENCGMELDYVAEALAGTLGFWQIALPRFGPMLVQTARADSWTHAVVVTGYFSDGAKTHLLEVLNVVSGAKRWVKLEDFRSEHLALVARGTLAPTVWHYGAPGAFRTWLKTVLGGKVG